MAKSPYVLRIELLDFYLQDSPDPVVVVRDQTVLTANKEARRRGIRSGISVRQAHAIVEGCKFKPWCKADYEERQRAWLDVCLDFTGIIEPDEQHSAWLDLSLHPKPIDIAERLVRTLNKTTGHAIKHGSGPSKWISTLALSQENGSLADRDPRRFLEPLPTSLLLPVLPAHRERLYFLGYRTIGQVAALSLTVLQEQFDEDAFAIQSAAKGSLTQLPVPRYPLNSVHECFIFDGPPETAEIVTNAKHALSKRIGERLSAHNQQSGKLNVAIEFEGGKIKHLSRTFTKLLRCPRSVESAICLLADSSLNSPVISIQATLPEIEKVKAVQSGLALGAVKDSKLVTESVERVRNAFGERAVLLGSELKLPRRISVLREWKHATGWQ